MYHKLVLCLTHPTTFVAQIILAIYTLDEQFLK